VRLRLLAAACTAALACAPAEATTITQTVSGSNTSGTPFSLFDPSIGTLDSVKIEGTLTYSESLVRNGAGDLSAVDISRAASENLLDIFTSSLITTTTVSGSETYPQGSIFGSISLSGSLFDVLTGSDVNKFFIVGNRTFSGFTVTANVAPQVGQILAGPGSPHGTYALTLTYYFTGLPEPSTWAMMLLGFAGIGWSLRFARATERKRGFAEQG
jgi:hypothetical protein